MNLYINTTANKEIEIAIEQNDIIIDKVNFPAYRQQSEKLLPSIKKILNKNKITLGQIKRIKVENRGGSFTALRIGISTANALAYALKIPVESSYGKLSSSRGIVSVRPEYSKKLEIN